MKIGGLGQRECDELKLLLDAEGIKYSISLDEELIKTNEAQKKETLAHYHPGNVNTNLLIINIEAKEFEKLSENALSNMKELGYFTDDLPHPSEFEVYNEDEPEYLKILRKKKEKRLMFVLGMTTLVSVLTYLILLVFSE